MQIGKSTQIEPMQRKVDVDRGRRKSGSTQIGSTQVGSRREIGKSELEADQKEHISHPLPISDVRRKIRPKPKSGNRKSRLVTEDRAPNLERPDVDRPK